MDLSDKTVIIPDIHNNVNTAEDIIKKENADKVVFLGDYFDDFYDLPEDAIKTAKWLSKSLKEENRTHLIGNHDLSYMTDNQNLKCSGYTEEKHHVIKNQSIKWSRLELYCWIDDWLCTHAGLSEGFYRQHGAGSIQNILDCSKIDLKKIHDRDYDHSFFQAGTLRGGPNMVGGPLWCDYNEFVDVPGVKQIFGHTKDAAVRHVQSLESEHYCIDTQLRHYAVYEGSMTIKRLLS